MPYELRKVRGGYEVRNAATGELHARHTSKAKAERQLRLLRMVEHGGTPRRS